ncbi:TrmB family transcriptional regulator [Candidatus Bathyarchaeota archaeon]|nr:TrmB family transcriptional regulator [Candidatus Bathyarchaeota archaeon]
MLWGCRGMAHLIGEYNRSSGKRQGRGDLKRIYEDEESVRIFGRIEDTLMRLGLSRNEAKVYLFLVRRREAKASEISAALSLNRTETYRILMNLQKIGLISTVFEKPLKFVALPLEKSLSLLIETKKMSLSMLEMEKEKIIESWRSLPKPEFPIPKREIFQLLEGYEHINLKARDIIEDVKGEICICASEDYLGRFYYAGLLDALEEAARRGVRVMLLAKETPKSMFFMRELRRSFIKYLGSEIDEIPFFIISDNEELLLFLDSLVERDRIGRPMALYTNCTVLIKALLKLFQSVWNGSAK